MTSFSEFFFRENKRSDVRKTQNKDNHDQEIRDCYMSNAMIHFESPTCASQPSSTAFSQKLSHSDLENLRSICSVRFSAAIDDSFPSSVDTISAISLKDNDKSEAGLTQFTADR